MDNTLKMQTENYNKIKKQTNRQAMATVNNLCLVYVLTSVCVYLLSVVYRKSVPLLVNVIASVARFVFGTSRVYADLLAKSVLGSYVISYSVSMLVTFIAFVIPFALYLHFIDRRSFDKAFPVDGRLLKGFLPVYAASQFLASIAAVLTQSIGSFIMPDIFAAQEAVMSGRYAVAGIFDLIVIFLMLCVFTPFAEEFVFRGVIYGSLRRFGTGFATVASSLIFGLAHGSVSQMAYATVFGIALAIVFEKTGNIKTSVLFHFFNNLLNYVLFVLVPHFSDMAVSNIVSLIYNILCAVAAVIGLVLLFSGKDASGTEKETADDNGGIAWEKIETGILYFLSPGTVLLVMNFIFNIYISLSV